MSQNSEMIETTFTVRWEDKKCVSIVEAVGEIDLATIPALKDSLVEASDAEDGMVIDLSRVTYMDSSGFSTLLEVSRVLRPMGLSLYLTAPNDTIRRMLELTRLNTIFVICPTVAAALESIQNDAQETKSEDEARAANAVAAAVSAA